MTPVSVRVFWVLLKVASVFRTMLPVQVLARSGKLKELIERAEAQLKNSPKSLQVHQTLADYYRAAGEREKVKQVYQKMAELKPDDAKMRYQVANLLVQAGDVNSAVDHYLAALKKDDDDSCHKAVKDGLAKAGLPMN